MSRDRDDAITYPKPIQDALDAIDDRVELLTRRIETLRRERDRIACCVSPIKPGDIIQWESKAGRVYTGQVLKVNCTKWSTSFVYRCHIHKKGGIPIGYSNVDADNNPQKIKSGRLPKQILDELKRAAKLTKAFGGG